MKRCAFNFSVNLDTDEPTSVFLDISSVVRLDRLLLETPLWPFWRMMFAYVSHVPKTVLRTVAVAFRLLFFRCDDLYVPDSEGYPDYTPPSPWPSFTPPRPGPPVIILNIKVDKDNLLRESVPADLFKEASSLSSVVVSSNSKITLTARRTCREPYILNGCFLGDVID